MNLTSQIVLLMPKIKARRLAIKLFPREKKIIMTNNNS